MTREARLLEIVARMRSVGPRYKSHDLGFVDSVSANSVDEWADEIEVLVREAAAGETRIVEHDVTPTTTAGEVAAHPPRFPTLTDAGETREVGARAVADDIVDRHGSLNCLGHRNVIAPYCTARPHHEPLCADCRALRDDIEAALIAIAAARRDPSVGRRED